MPKLNMLTRGIQREQANTITKQPRLPITPTMLCLIRALWSTKEFDFDYIMLWAAMCVEFLFRMGELTVPSEDSFHHSILLTFKDIAVDSMTDTKLIGITLKQSKTDQFRRGMQVLIGRL